MLGVPRASAARRVASRSETITVVPDPLNDGRVQCGCGDRSLLKGRSRGPADTGVDGLRHLGKTSFQYQTLLDVANGTDLSLRLTPKILVPFFPRAHFAIQIFELSSDFLGKSVCVIFATIFAHTRHSTAVAFLSIRLQDL